MLVRQEFRFGFAALLAISFFSGAAVLESNLREIAYADSLLTSAQVGTLASRLADALAMERGLTVSLLSAVAPAPGRPIDSLVKPREVVDTLYANLVPAADQILVGTSGGPSRVLFDKLTADQNSLIWLREQADARLYGGQGEFDHEFWIRRLSESIKNVQDLAVHANLPISGSASIPPATNVAKYILLALAEQLGRDRAILVSAIARKAPLDQQELHELATQRIVANTACRRLEDLLREAPPATKDSLAGLDCSGLLSSYERLRQSLVEAGLGGANYPLTAEKWFDEASRHIAQVTRLIDSTDALIAAEADRHRSRSLRNLALAALVLLLLTGLSGRLLWSLRRRVFIPIKTLERAARTVSGGALNAPIPPGRDDEIGSLSRSIVQMRDTLVEALRRGEQSTSELRKLSAVIEHNANAITITDAHGSIQYANPGFAAITGYDCKEALGRKAGFWRSGMTPPELYRSMWASITRGKVWQGTLINRRKDGRLDYIGHLCRSAQSSTSTGC